MKQVKRLVAVLMCGVALTACATPSQMYWDHKVKELCEKDGGVTVYEKVELTKEEYAKLNIPFERNANSDSPYYRVSLEDVVISESPKVGKDVQKIVRRSDGKTLGQLVRYGRSGGDVIEIDQPSHYGCENIEGINMKLTQSIFVVKEN